MDTSNPSALRDLLIDRLENFPKSYIIKSLVSRLNIDECAELFDDIEREVF